MFGTFNAKTIITTLSVADIAKLTPTELALLSKNQASELTSDQLSALNSTGLTAIAGVFKAIPVNQLSGINTTAISGLVVKALTPDQVKNLSIEQLDALTSSQVAELSATQLFSLGEEALQALDLTAVKMVNLGKQFSYLSTEQISKLDAVQLGALNPIQLQSITADQAAALLPTQAKNITSNFMKYLPAESISALTGSVMAALPAKSFSSITHLEGLTYENTPFLTSTQLSTLSSAQIQSMSASNDDLQFLSKEALAGLNKKNIVGVDVTKLTVEQVLNLTAEQLSNLSTAASGNNHPNQIEALSTDQVEVLTANQMRGVPPAFIKALALDDVAHLSDVAVAAITPKSLSTMTNFSGLTPDNLVLMSSAQVNALTADQIDKMSGVDNDIQYLSNAALAGLDKKNLAKINLEKLTVEQFVSLSSEQLNAAAATASNITGTASITAEQIAALTSKQAAGLGTAFAAALDATQVSALSPEAIAALAPKTFIKIGNDLSGLTPENASLITSAQINALTADQITQLSATDQTLRYLSTSALAGLDKKNIVGLTHLIAGSLQVLTSEQFAALKPAQIAWLPNSAIADLTNPDNVDLLNKAAISVLSYPQISQLPTSSFSIIPASSFSVLTARQIAGLSDGGIAANVSNQIHQLTSEQAAALTSDAIKGLVAAQVDGGNTYGLTSEAFGAINPLSLTAMQPATLKAVSDSTFAGITANQLTKLSATQIKALEVAQIAKLDEEDAAALTGTQVAVWSAEQATALTSSAIAAMAPDVVAKLNITYFDGAGTTADIAALTNQQFQKLTTAQIKTINPTNAGLILPTQIEGVSTLNSLPNVEGSLSIAALSNNVIAALSSFQISKLDGAHLDAITVVQAAYLNTEVKDWAYSKGYSVVATASGSEVKGITAAATVTGAAAASTITAGKNAVSMTGGAGADTMIGSPKNDVISGGSAFALDSIDAGAGNDIITFINAGSNADLSGTIEGGDGADKLILGTASTGITNAGFAKIIGIETLQLASGANTIDLGSNTTSLTKIITGAGTTSITTINDISIDAANLGANTLTLAGIGNVTVTGGSDAETYRFSPSASNVGTSLVIITNYANASDIIDFGSAATLATIDTTDAIGGENVGVNDVGFVNFNRTDSTYDKKVAAILADEGLNAANALALFTSGSDSYIYFSGASNSDADDQIIKLGNVTGSGLKLDTGKIVAINALGAPTLRLAANQDTGVLANDGNTSIAALVFNGTATPSATVTIYDGSTLLGSSTADAITGAYTFTSSTLSDGAHTLTAKAVKTGYTQSIASSPDLNVTVDATSPTVTSFSSTTTDGTKKIGDAINITATTSEAVTSGQSMVVTLDNGKTVTLTAASTGTSLSGTYTVAEGDTASSDLTVASFTTGTVTDAAGNALALTVPTGTSNIAGAKAIIVDAIKPTVTAFSSTTTDGTKKIGDAINITATTSEAVTSGQSIVVTLDNGKMVTLTAASTGTSLSGTYTVAEGDTASSDLTVASFTAGTVTDVAGNALALTVPTGTSNIAGAKAIVLDAIKPTATITDNQSGVASSAVLYTFTLSEASSDFTLSDITVAGGTKAATLSTVSPTSYTLSVTPDVNSTVPITVDVAAGSFTDAAGNLNGAAQQNTQNVDTVKPTVTAFSSTTTDGTKKIGDAINITATTSEAVTSGQSMVVTLDNGKTVTLTAVSTGTSLSGTYTVAEADTASSDLTVASFTAGTVTDAVGNALALTVPTGTSNIAGAKAIVVDAIKPTVTTFSSTTTDGTKKIGDTINIMATTSEAVTSGQSMVVTLDNGKTVTLTAASTGTSLSGTYTVAEGDTASSDLTVASFTAGNVTDAAGNALALTVPTGTSNIAGSKAIVVDAVIDPNIVRFTGKVSDYQLTYDLNALTITKDSVQTLNSIQIAKFTDGSIECVLSNSFHKVGSEFQINTYTNNNQKYPEITKLKSGDFIVSWMSDGQDGSGSGIYAQRYAADGTKQGAEFQINSYTNKDQGSPKIIGLKNGGFIVAWTSDGQDGSGWGIYAQRYSADGIKQGSEFQINTNVNDNQTDISITALNNSGFVVSWATWGWDVNGKLYGNIYGQMYDVSGNKQGSEFLVNTAKNNQYAPSICTLNDNSFVITWNDQDGVGNGVHGQHYAADGTKQGAEFQINTYTNKDQGSPKIIGLKNGGFIVAWTSDGQDGSGWGIYAQRYSSDGTKDGNEFKVNTTTNDNQTSPSIIASSDGGFVFSWESWGWVNGTLYGNIYGQSYDASGNKQGSEFLVNTAKNNQYTPSISSLNDNSFLVAWQDQDGAGTGIHGQRYGKTNLKFVGDDSSQSLSGTNQDDQFSGLGGNDTINGGDGIDTVIYSGNRNDYIITYSSDGSVGISDNRSSTIDGNDVLINIENIQFNNQIDSLLYMTLASDSGGNNRDYITNVNTINVTLVSDAISWEYTLNGNDSTPTWVKGTSTTFNMTSDTTYAIGDIKLREIDKSGNIIATSSNTVQWKEDSTKPIAKTVTLTQMEAKVNGVVANKTADAGDKLIFTFGEAVDISVVGPLFTGENDVAAFFGASGTRATAVWSADNTIVTVTLGVGEKINTGTIISFAGISDVAGNIDTLYFPTLWYV